MALANMACSGHLPRQLFAPIFPAERRAPASKLDIVIFYCLGALMGFRAGRRCSVTLLVGIMAIGLACTKTPDDSQLTRQIQSKLNEDSGLHGKPITVQTSGGVVTLSGTVENETQREAAARYASATPGIKQVVNNLETTSAPATRAAGHMAQAQVPAQVKPSAKPRPSTPRHREEPDSTEMAANAPPP